MLQAAVQGMPLEEVIGNILNGEWDHKRTKFSLPPLMTLVSIMSFIIHHLNYNAFVSIDGMFSM